MLRVFPSRFLDFSSRLLITLGIGVLNDTTGQGPSSAFDLNGTSVFFFCIIPRALPSVAEEYIYVDKKRLQLGRDGEESLKDNLHVPGVDGGRQHMTFLRQQPHEPSDPPQEWQAPLFRY